MGQIAYDLTFNCNIVNRRKNLTNIYIIYIQRHCSSEQSNNNQRGVVMGQCVEGITATNIKDTWTKSRGRVVAGEGGGFG